MAKVSKTSNQNLRKLKGVAGDILGNTGHLIILKRKTLNNLFECLK